MNDSIFVSENLSSAHFVLGGIGGCLTFIYAISMLITFPLYTYVHRINKKTDKLAYFYPITKHFYTVIYSMQFYMYVTIFISLVTWLVFDSIRALSAVFISFSLGYLIGVAVTSVQNVLLFVLALRRFLIFFVPNFKKMISIDPKTFSIVLKLLYAFYIVIQVVTKIYKMVCGTNSAIRAGVITLVNASETRVPNKTADEEKVNRAHDIYENCSESVDNFYMKIYLAGDFLVMLAAVLYGIMFIKIRRWSKMTGDQLNHPEKYIFYQTLLIVFTKLLAITMIILYVMQTKYSDEATFGIFVISDITTTPLVIQCSYLLCNRANVDTILGIQFKKLRTWLILICGEDPGRRPRRRRNAAARYKAAKKKVKDLISTVGRKTLTQVRHKEVAVLEPNIIIIRPEYFERRRGTIS